MFSIESLISLAFVGNKTGMVGFCIENMPGFVSGKKRTIDQACSVIKDAACSKSPHSTSRGSNDLDAPLIPGLTDDVAKHCLALVPRANFPAMGGVCRKWRSFLHSKEFITVRRLAGVVEEWLYVLTMDSQKYESHWEVLDCLGYKHGLIPPMPGPVKAGFGVVTLNGKLIVIGGYSLIDRSPSSDVYQYDSCLNSWRKLADMNVRRYDFACTEVNSLVYAVGGYGVQGEGLSSSEVYDPDADKWTVIEPLRCPRWGSFACGFNGKLYIMGGRSSFTIGNSRSMDIYDPDDATWTTSIKNGCVMVTAHAVLGNKLFCMEWKNQRKISMFNPEDGSWKTILVPLTGSSMVGFRFGVMDGKLILFSLEEEPGYSTLLYDPDAAPGSEWKNCRIRPSGVCLCCVTVRA